MKIGYARVSTVDQRLDMWVSALCYAGCERFYEEKASGCNVDMSELAKLLKGGVLMVRNLD